MNWYKYRSVRLLKNCPKKELRDLYDLMHYAHELTWGYPVSIKYSNKKIYIIPRVDCASMIMNASKVLEEEGLSGYRITLMESGILVLDIPHWIKKTERWYEWGNRKKYPYDFLFY